MTTANRHLMCVITTTATKTTTTTETKIYVYTTATTIYILQRLRLLLVRPLLPLLLLLLQRLRLRLRQLLFLTTRNPSRLSHADGDNTRKGSVYSSVRRLLYIHISMSIDVVVGSAKYSNSPSDVHYDYND